MPEALPPYNVIKLKDNANKITNYLLIEFGQINMNLRGWSLRGQNSAGLIDSNSFNRGTGMSLNNRTTKLDGEISPFGTLRFANSIPTLKYGDAGTFTTYDYQTMSATYIGFGEIINGRYVAFRKSVRL